MTSIAIAAISARNRPNRRAAIGLFSLLAILAGESGYCAPVKYVPSQEASISISSGASNEDLQAHFNNYAFSTGVFDGDIRGAPVTVQSAPIASDLNPFAPSMRSVRDTVLEEIRPLPQYEDELRLRVTREIESPIQMIGYRYLTAVSKFNNLSQYALILETPRSWRYRLRSGGLLESRIMVAVGLMKQGDVAHTFLSVGPVLKLSSASSRFSAEIGLSPTLMEDSMFADRELGGRLHFTSHVAGIISFGRQRRHLIAIHLQHISNGGLSSTNPGVDMLGIEYRWLTSAKKRFCCSFGLEN